MVHKILQDILEVGHFRYIRCKKHFHQMYRVALNLMFSKLFSRIFSVVYT